MFERQRRHRIIISSSAPAPPTIILSFSYSVYAFHVLSILQILQPPPLGPCDADTIKHGCHLLPPSCLSTASSSTIHIHPPHDINRQLSAPSSNNYPRCTCCLPPLKPSPPSPWLKVKMIGKPLVCGIMRVSLSSYNNDIS
jgi:uncharacterized CHY-type Zn-finger protein